MSQAVMIFVQVEFCNAFETLSNKRLRKLYKNCAFRFIFFDGFLFRVIYSGGDKLPARVDVEFKSIFERVDPTVLKNIGTDNSSYSLIATGE